MSEFEKWFKTTEAYKMLEEQNYFKMDLFFSVGARNQYRHTSVQVAYLNWQHQQAIIDNLKAQLSLQRDRNKALETELTSSRNYGDGLHEQLDNMEACYIEKKKQVEDALHILDELYRKGLFAKPKAVSEAINVLRGGS